jgi:HK97 family phage portal protein
VGRERLKENELTVSGILSEISRYSQSQTGIYVPKIGLKNSSSRAIEVSPYSGKPISLEQHVRSQVFQSRYKYFVFGEMYRRHIWTRACIDYITRRATRDPNRLIDRRDPLNPDIVDLREFLDEACPDYDFDQLYFGWMQDVLKFGQAYAYVEKSQAGDPIAIWPMDARITFPITDQHGTILVHCQNYNGMVEFFEKDEILYFSINNNSSDPKTLPIMETLVDTVALEMNADKFNAALFEHGLNIGAVFSMPGATEEEVKDNIRFLEDKHSKAENAHRHVVLRGETKMLRDGMQSQKDIMFEELVRVSRHKTCSAFGVPESLLGIPDNTNKATADAHERQTYVTTVRPFRRLINGQFTRQFIRRDWGSKNVRLEEPLNSMLPTDAEIEAVGKVADIGGNFNDLQEMLGFERVPNGDYMVMKIPGAGGYARLDTIAMPGLGDPHFDFEAYQIMHEAEAQQQNDMAVNGIQAPPPSTVYIQPRPQDQIQKEPIAARIVDVSRSMLEDDTYDVVDVYELNGQVVSRRIPTSPQSRGGKGYTTKSGRFRYGAPPKGTLNRPKTETKSGEQSQNDLTNPRDPNLPRNQSPEEKLAVKSARSEVSVTLRKAQEENWTNEQFFRELESQGWETAPGKELYQDTRDAKADARRLSELYPDKAYTIIGSDGHYQIMQKDLSAFGEETIEDGGKDLTNDTIEQQAERGQKRINQGKPEQPKTVKRSMQGFDMNGWLDKLDAFTKGA